MFGGSRQWTEQTVIKHPWHEVMKSVQFKYPNPYNPNVLNIDVLSREVDSKLGILRTCKLINSTWAMASHLGHLKAIEYSFIQIPEKRMTSRTINIDLRGVLTGVEDMEYIVHPENDEWTLLKHTVSVDAFSLIAYSALSISRQTAVQGLNAINWVINHRLPILHTSTKEDYCPPETIPNLLASSADNQLSESALTNNPFIQSDDPLISSKPRHAFILGNWNQPLKPSVPNIQSSLPKSYPRSSSLFFADLPSRTNITPSSGLTSSAFTTINSSPSSPISTDSPLNYLESQLETLSRDVTAITDAVVRRSQRVARLFSRIDEYVVIM